MLKKLPKLDSIDGQIVFRDLYEDFFKIFPHRTPNPNRPLASVAFHPAENINRFSMLEETMRVYINKNIGNKFRLSFTEFVDLPFDIFQMLIRVSSETTAEESSKLAELEKDFN